MTQDEAKRLVAKRAVEFVQDGMVVGLGTGTTATLFIRELAVCGLKIRCVASSDVSHDLAESLGMSVATLTELPELDVYIDGADEIAKVKGMGFALIKGGGGALLREKIVASAAKSFIVVADSTKMVDVLGKFPLPVEVIKMALPVVQPKLVALGLNPKLRQAKNGAESYLTDEGNYILDCACGLIEEPEKTAAAIRGIVGVVEHGLFLGMATLALVGGDDGVSEYRP
ncbi:MAG TPA: ribose-5-phosphate isomerase RpiA [Acidobacteriaceae bacterium]|jgi:ribose 5-phosphate isomerase A|nr:ribose-5-phosphate isomerase RpiA [Acidobacteriaceae bacterium]